MARHEIQWVTAAPLWHAREVAPGAIVAPDILRFESDDFMERLAETLARHPARLVDQVAGPQSYRPRPPGASLPWRPTLDAVRLFQPVHGHFNLVMATLVCRVPGLPDHAVEPARGEEVGFVLRRVREVAGGKRQEMAWVPNGAKGRTWTPIPNGDEGKVFGVEAGAEELLPVFPMPYSDQGRTRRLWAGLIPTASQETFTATRAVVPDSLPAADATSPSGLNVPEARSLDVAWLEARARVVEGIRTLSAPYPPTAPANRYDAQEIETSRFLLLDLADLLFTHLDAAWARDASAPPPPAGSARRALYNDLNARGWLPGLRAALAEWAAISGEGAAGATSSIHTNLRNAVPPVAAFAAKLDDAQAEVAAARALEPAGGAPAEAGEGAGEEAPRLPRFDDDGARYVVRCVYRRTRCRPPHPDIVGVPSVDFTIAPYFDPDAPSRPIRIALPVDTSVSGLRKFRKSVAFLMSDQLRKQMGQASSLKDLLDGKAGSEEPFSLGEICTFSIPIITLCAFIVLMIFMILLNFVFWWLPLLRFCFPIPKPAGGRS
jgi:hypothetical protein